MPKPVCKVADILFVRFELTDLEPQKEYMDHFGVHLVKETEDTVYYRGTGIAPFLYVASRGDSNRYVGAGYYVDSYDDLKNLAEATRTDIEENTEPGGGQLVRTQDPDGLGVEVYFGMDFTDPEEQAPPPLNAGYKKDRVNVLQRIGAASDEWVLKDGEWIYNLTSRVKRLGHSAINVGNPDASIEWYQNTLGFLISDNLFLPDGETRFGVFMRADRGDKPTDHHVLNILGTLPGKEQFAGTFGHAGFEVAGSIDDLLAGHYHIKTTGKYVHEWGIGRHLLGSQIYDYWRDPQGFTLEHWTDGDLVDSSIPTNDITARQVIMAQYGPLVPSSFNFSMPNEEIVNYREQNPGYSDLVKEMES